MSDALVMRRAKRVTDLRGILQGLIEWQRTFDRLALDVLHHQIIRPDVMQRTDVRMIQRGDSSCLASETLGELLTGNFDGHDAVKTRVERLVHLAHAAHAD